MEPRAGAEEDLTTQARATRGSGGRRRGPQRSSSRAVLVVGAAMIVAQLGYRAWAVYGGWFLIDDFGFLARAVDSELDLDYLFTPYGDHFQPLGFLIVWFVGHSVPYDWGLASSITLALQALASAACFLFLLRLGGRTWRILVPLAFYLFGITTLPGFMWWAAAVVQLPLQLAAFLALTAHVEYLRSGRRRWIALTTAALLLGMLCDVKVLFVALAMLFLSLYLNDGVGMRGRVREVVVVQWRALVPIGLLFAGYLVVYFSVNPSAGRGLVAPAGVFDSMVRVVLGPVLLGGPWRWGSVGDAPLPPPATPEWAVTLAWVVLALVFVHLVRRRRSAAWVLALMLVAVSVNAAMVSLARGALFRGAAGLEVRYLGDLAPTLVVVLAVLALQLPPKRPADVSLSAAEEERPAPPRSRQALGSLAVVAALAGAMVSSTLYVLNWHADYPARVFFQNVVAQAEQRPLTLLDQRIADEVILPKLGATEFEVPSQVFTPLGDRIVAGARMNDPDVLSPEGIAYPASIDAVRQSEPGPVDGCGHVVRQQRPRTIPLAPAADDAPTSDIWWASIGYLASGDGVATLSFDGLSTDMEVRRGLHDYYFLIPGSADEVTLQSRSDLTLCVDNLRVGTLTPFEGVDAP